AEVVAASGVRVEQDLVPEVAAEQFRDRQFEDLTRQVPQRHINAAQHFDLAPALRVGIEHVVEVYLDGERIFADQSEIRQAAGAVVGRDYGPGDGTGGVALAIPGQTGVRIDADKRPSVFELQRLDPGDLAETLRGCCQCLISHERSADG